MKRPIKVGQKMWANPEGPNSIKRGNNYPIEVEVASVGRKYLTIKDAESSWRFARAKFIIDTLMEDGGNYSPEWRLYHSIEDIKEKRERAELIAILKRFDFMALDLERLRKVKSIIQEQ